MPDWKELRRLQCTCDELDQSIARITYYVNSATNRLERSRRLQRCIGSANAYHSDASVLAMTAQEVDRTFPLPYEHKHSTHFQPKTVQ